MPLQQALPAWVVLNNSNDASASGMADVFTNFPYNAGGLNLGDYFDCTSVEAFKNCQPSIGILYAGRYRRVQVDSGATAANVKTGTVGCMPSQAAQGKNVGNIGGQLPFSMNVVTSFDQSIGGGSKVVHPCIFLNTVTPGNFCWVQELGVATVLGAASFNASPPAIGDEVQVTTNGLVTDPLQSTQLTSVTFSSILGTAVDIPIQGAKFRIVLDGIGPVQD
jgi:hypothetical protein